MTRCSRDCSQVVPHKLQCQFLRQLPRLRIVWIRAVEPMTGARIAVQFRSDSVVSKRIGNQLGIGNRVRRPIVDLHVFRPVRNRTNSRK